MNFKISILLSAAMLICANSSFGQIVGSDDFDGGEMFMSRTFTPDNSANGGTFPSSIFDVFGIVDRTVNFDFIDDTLTDPNFQGMLPTTVTDSFLGIEDIVNGDNPSGTAELVYTMDVSGATNLMFSADFACFGDFEDPEDVFEITASIDGSTPELLIKLIAAEDVTQTYTFEDGGTADIDDPFSIQGTNLNNNFQNFSAPITGTGSTLTLRFYFEANGGNEATAINNVVVEGMKGKGGMLGDVNCDGEVSLLDVAPFVDLLSNGGFSTKADINMDGEVDLLDVTPFVALLTGG